MITQDEGVRLATIKAKLLAKKPVSSTDAQWALTMVAREGLALRASVLQRAATEGFDVSGIASE